MFEYTLRFIWDLFESLSNNLMPIFDFLNRTFVIGEHTFSVYEIIFGSGFIVVLGIRIGAWVLSVVIPN